MIESVCLKIPLNDVRKASAALAPHSKRGFLVVASAPVGADLFLVLEKPPMFSARAGEKRGEDKGGG